MQPKKWNTLRLAFYGIPLGAAVSAVQTMRRTPDVPADVVSYAIAGEIIGGAVGGALLFAAVSGIRNLLVR